jgi:LacI family transcriptional regulator
MKEKRTSLADIAESIGVSKATVSFVLNDKGDEFNISKEKQRLIREKAKELRYVPNYFAKSLRQGKTKTIGLVLADISNPFYAELCKTIQEGLYKNGYNALIVNTNDDKELEKTLMRELLQRSIDGMIISPSNDIQELIPILHETHIPVVFVDRPGDDAADFVGIDNEKEVKNLIISFSFKPKKLVVLSQLSESAPTNPKKIEAFKTVCAAEKIDLVALNLPENQAEIDIMIKRELDNGADSFLPLNNAIVYPFLQCSHLVFDQPTLRVPPNGGKGLRQTARPVCLYGEPFETFLIKRLRNLRKSVDKTPNEEMKGDIV